MPPLVHRQQHCAGSDVANRHQLKMKGKQQNIFIDNQHGMVRDPSSKGWNIQDMNYPIRNHQGLIGKGRIVVSACMPKSQILHLLKLPTQLQNRTKTHQSESMSTACLFRTLSVALTGAAELLFSRCPQPSVMSYFTQGRHGLVLYSRPMPSL